MCNHPACKHHAGQHHEPGIYRIFLLTVWKREGDAQAFRFVLEDPRSGARDGFRNVEGLLNGLLTISGLRPGCTCHHDDRQAETGKGTSTESPDC